MDISESFENFNNQLNDLTVQFNSFYNSLKNLKGKSVYQSLIKKSQEYLRNLAARLEKIKKVYEVFTRQLDGDCNNYMNEMSKIEEEDVFDIDGLKQEFSTFKEEFIGKKNEGLNKMTSPSFIYRQGKESKVNAELAMKYPGSYFYKEYNSDRRTGDGNIFIDHDGTNDGLVYKYMEDDNSLNQDIKKMDNEKRSNLLDDLSFLKLPIKKDFVKELGHNEDNEIMEAWKNRRALIVNNEYNKDFIELLKKNQLFDTVFKNQNLGRIQYIEDQKSFTMAITLKYYDVIVDCLKNEKMINKELIKKNSDKGDADEMINEMRMMGIELNDDNKEEIRGCFALPLFMNISNIIDNRKYDNALREWVGEHEWKMIYRASAHDYSASSFHSHCDDKGPTLVVIKSSGGWIFGGYTTKSWKVVHPDKWGGIYYNMID